MHVLLPLNFTHQQILKEEFKTHFRNVSRIMDCVGCDKCRLWGKVQTTGIATALKVLFELDEMTLNPQTNHDLLQRSEVVALINTLFRFSESLKAVEDFRRMWRNLDSSDTQTIVTEIDKMTHPKPKISPSVNEGYSKYLFDSACAHSITIMQSCKESIRENVTQAFSVLGQALNAVLSTFRPSGEDPSPSYSEL